MPKKVFTEPVLKPGDKGFNNPVTPWGKVRNIIGWQNEGVHLEIDGFYLIDRRRKPPLAIFKNCEVDIVNNVNPVLLVEPKPFAYLGEALHHRDRMHLSSDDEKMVVPVALCPDRGIGYPSPQYLLIDPKEAKQR